MSLVSWEKKSKFINVVVDNDSWIRPYAHELVCELNKNGYASQFISNYQELKTSDISFYLGCTRITPQDILERSHKNLVVHESALPQGKGFSPLTWQILEGRNTIPILLLEMSDKVDSGSIIFEDTLHFHGDELLEELHAQQGRKTIELCLKYALSSQMPIGRPQVGNESFYERRRPTDSRLDVDKPIKEIFNLFRVVDNNKYPAFFELYGCRYNLKIEKIKNE